MSRIKISALELQTGCEKSLLRFESIFDLCGCESWNGNLRPFALHQISITKPRCRYFLCEPPIRSLISAFKCHILGWYNSFYWMQNPNGPRNIILSNYCYKLKSSIWFVCLGCKRLYDDEFIENILNGLILGLISHIRRHAADKANVSDAVCGCAFIFKQIYSTHVNPKSMELWWEKMRKMRRALSPDTQYPTWKRIIEQSKSTRSIEFGPITITSTAKATRPRNNKKKWRGKDSKIRHNTHVPHRSVYRACEIE